MLTRILPAVAGAVVIAAAAPASAVADKVVEAQTAYRFDAMTYSLDQGELLTFRNADAASPGPHNVTASQRGADGRPLFASQTIPNGQSSVVDGAQQLKTASYPFLCTVHPFMTATLVVTDKGTPLPPPGSPPPPAGAADTQAPAVTASLRRTSLRAALRKRRFTAYVTSSEPATLRLRLTARIERRTVLVGAATAKVEAANADATVAVRVRHSARRALRRARRVALTLAVEARDATGNVGTTRARSTVSARA